MSTLCLPDFVQKSYTVPNIWMVLLSTLFPGSTLLAGPKHSTKVPFSARVAVPLSVDVKEVALVPNPIPDLAVKAVVGPQVAMEGFDLCERLHSSLVVFPTLHMVNPLLPPLTVHLKVKVSPGQVGGAAVNCPVTSSGERIHLQVSKYPYAYIIFTGLV